MPAMYSPVYGAMPGEPQEKRRRSELTRTPSPGFLDPPHIMDSDASPVGTSGSSAGSPTSPEYLSSSERYHQPVAKKHSSESLDATANGFQDPHGNGSGSGVIRSVSLVLPAFQAMEVIDPRRVANEKPVIPNLKFSVGTGRSTSLSPQAKVARAPRTYRKARNAKSVMEDAPSLPLNESMDQRRQKRLERNRESARLSRRRRKQYLDVLEERVAQLSIEMDQGRRDHVMDAIITIQEKRRQVLLSGHMNAAKFLDTSLSRASLELRIANTFHTQQLKSFSFPMYTKFVLWLTLQGDVYFRGGRAASERLSAARIGERMLSSGTDRASPTQAMWPLLCNEIGLSYDQEERIRNYQRSLLQTHDSWLHRHTALASDMAMSSAHDGVQGLTERVGQRDAAFFSRLTEQQRLKYQTWAIHNKDRLARVMGRKPRPDKPMFAFKTSPSYHIAANLYIVNHHLQHTPRAAPLVSGATALKRLMQRPSFESLGCAGDRSGKEEGNELSRESSFPSAGSFPSSNSLKQSQSFASSGSLKRSASEMSMEGEEVRPQIPPINPEMAEAAASSTVDAALGFVRGLIPLPPPSSAPPVTSDMEATADPLNFSIPMPTPVSTETITAVPMPVLSSADPGQFVVASTDAPPPQGHFRTPSFLPPHLNVVPEESFLPDNAEDFFLSLTEEDWAIGEGLDMDTAN